MRDIKIVSTYLAVMVVLIVAPFSNARADFQSGMFITYAQQSWGSVGTPASQLLAAHVDSLYPNGVEVGIPGATGSSALFTTLQSILSYLPQGGVPGPLDNDYLDPTTTSSGVFGGYVLALQFNVDFNDAGFLIGTSAIRFGDLVLVDTAYPDFNGLTVRQHLDLVNDFLGGASLPYSYDDIASLTDSITLAFEGGVPTQFAQDHLAVAPESVPEPSSMSLLLLGALLLVHRRVTRQT